MSIETQFETLGIGSLEAVKIMRLLGMGTLDIQDPAQFEKLKDVVRKFQNDPNRDFILRRVTLKSAGDKLQKAWEYAQLLDRKEETMKTYKEIIDHKNTIVRFANDKGARFEMMPDYMQSVAEIDRLTKELSSVDSEIKLYEN